MTAVEKIDLVYTWVDDAWPGYQAELARHAQRPADANPERTRDNLDLFRYSLRSLEPLPEFVGTIYLVSCRPQVPRWLNAQHPQMRIVHHDQIMDPAILPTFNSLAIISHLHKIPGLTRRFIYFEDDLLMRRPLSMDLFEDVQEKLRLFPWHTWEPQPDDANRDVLTPWQAALARSGALLNARYGLRRRRELSHYPKLIEPKSWQRMTEIFKPDFAATRAAKFRNAGCVAPEHLYPWMMLEEERAVLESEATTDQRSLFVPLTNSLWGTWHALRRARTETAYWVNLNDEFGPRPSRLVSRMVRWQLEAWYPAPSRFEF